MIYNILSVVFGLCPRQSQFDMTKRSSSLNAYLYIPKQVATSSIPVNCLIQIFCIHSLQYRVVPDFNQLWIHLIMQVGIETNCRGKWNCDCLCRF